VQSLIHYYLLLNIQDATVCSLEKVNFKVKTVVSFEPHVLFQQNLQDMWTESSSVNSANLVNISATIPEISNFS